MLGLNKIWQGLLLTLIPALPAWFLGENFPVVGAPVLGIVLGILMGLVIKDRTPFQAGLIFASKKILQYAVILLGFGLNLGLVMQTGLQSLPIILTTIAAALLLAGAVSKWLRLPTEIATLIGVGSSICGGSAIAATAPVIDADDDSVAQAISVIFLFNVLAALLFPALGGLLGFDTHSGQAFGIFAGTAVNDTSSVTATASTWDSLYQLGSQTLDQAVTVKLTRTLAIIPITLALAFYGAAKERDKAQTFSLKKTFPVFILYFILASLITTICTNLGLSAEVFVPLKTLSKFFIVLAMTAIGLNTNLIRLIKTGGKPVLLGFICWTGITIVSLLMQKVMGIW